MMRRGEEKGVHAMTDRNQAMSKTFREKNGLSLTKTAFKWFGISGCSGEREHLLIGALFREFGRLFV